jgi:hypothetical protein
MMIVAEIVIVAVKLVGILRAEAREAHQTAEEAVQEETVHLRQVAEVPQAVREEAAPVAAIPVGEVLELCLVRK